MKNETPTPLCNAFFTEFNLHHKGNIRGFARDLEQKLAVAREALETIIRVDSNTASENAEDELPSIHELATSALKATE